MGIFGKLFGRTSRDGVNVRFHDADTGKVFAESQVPLQQLPASFEAETTMHMMDADWIVVEARPVTVAEFGQSRQLDLSVRKVEIQRVDPSTVLYSLPTINNELPSVVPRSSKLGKRVIEIHEDDWRQIEWIPASASPLIEAELEKVRHIHEIERQGIGFRKIHIREAIPAPLQSVQLTLNALRDALGQSATWLEGFAYRGQAGVVGGSFSLRLLSSVELYGVVSEDVIQAICFANTRANNVPQPDARNLLEFAARHDLLLIDWCRAQVIPPLEAEYTAFLNPAQV